MIGVGTCNISAKGKTYVNQVLDANRLSYGPFLRKFENVFSAAHGARFAIMSNSGTSSLLVSLAALKNRYAWKDGDEVIVPSVTFVATSNVVLQLGLKPVFVDVDPIFYELDPQLLEKSITSRTRCIMPVHLFGCPCDMDPIMEIANKYNLKVVEDSCETMFANYKGRPVGSIGDIGCFSTYVAHILTTGVGGLSITNDIDLATSMRSLVNHGRDSIYISIDDDKDKSISETRLIADRRFSFIQMGYSFRVTEMEGALGLAEFEEREDMLLKRRSNAAFLMKELAPFSEHIQLPTIRENCDHSFMMFPLVLKNESKKKLVYHLEENGIETRDMLPLINQPFYKDLFNINEDEYPVAKWINNNGFYIASHQGLSVYEKEYIVEKFHDFFVNKRSTSKAKVCLIIMSKLDSRPSHLALESFYESLPKESLDEIILVDDSPFLEIREFFKGKNIPVISENKGKGDGIIKAVRKTNCENIVVMGIDGADDIQDLDSLLIGLRGGADLVIASRFMSGGQRKFKRSVSYHSIGNRFFSFLLSLLYDENVSDCNNLFRAFRKSAFLDADVKDQDESFMFSMTVNFLSKSKNLMEVPTIERANQLERNRQNRFLSAIRFLSILISRALKK